MPDICIIIPVYNAEQYIDRCLQSVLKQTFQDYQVLLINDGSTDNSLELCRRYSEKDPRFITLDKQNGGAASARNMGLDWYYEKCDSPWFCFIDIDDFIHERYLEVLLNAVKQTGAAISMCSYEITRKNTLPEINVNFSARRFDTEQLWCERQINCTSPCAKLFSRASFSGIRFPEGIIHEDEYTLYQALFQEKELAFVDLPLYGYYQTETSVMRGNWTPRHMTEPTGILNQMQFFRENGFIHAEQYAARMYLQSLYRNMLGAYNAGTDMCTCAQQLKHSLRKGLFQYGKLADVSIRNESWLYYSAFPVMTTPYRLFKKFTAKQKRK